MCHFDGDMLEVKFYIFLLVIHTLWFLWQVVATIIKAKLANFYAEAKKEFSDDCSVQVYSVQACIPKDPVALWNAEFVQAEELFRLPLSVDNCLLDNRYKTYISESSNLNHYHCFGVDIIFHTLDMQIIKNFDKYSLFQQGG